MTTIRRLAGTLAALVLLAGAAACGSDQSDQRGQSGSAQDAHAKADVAFASQMIPHHRQAVEMADMVEGKDVSPALRGLAAQIRAAQAPEIRTMSGWLEGWGETVPEDSGHEMSGMSGMAGMMSEDDMTSLDAATGAAFERQWLTMMIEHHQGALTMARAEQDDGRYGPAKRLAGQIIAGQTKEIATMKRMLAGS